MEDNLARLAIYTTAIMGKRTYEFGYRFGLKPGQNPYWHMAPHVFSRSEELPADAHVTLNETSDTHLFGVLKASSGGPIYLCGGGAFAGSLHAAELIDLVRLKRAPVVLGDGVRLFGEAAVSSALRYIETRYYDGGYVFQEYEVLA